MSSFDDAALSQISDKPGWACQLIRGVLAVMGSDYSLPTCQDGEARSVMVEGESTA